MHFKTRTLPNVLILMKALFDMFITDSKLSSFTYKFQFTKIKHLHLYLFRLVIGLLEINEFHYSKSV